MIIALIIYEIVCLIVSDGVLDFVKWNVFAFYIVTIFVGFYIACWGFTHG
nr:MAG TPA: hypothetical protein [Caudoviricetes sp.]